jgi:aminopeptidase-like protein
VSGPGGLDWAALPSPGDTGAEMHAFLAEILPLPRSLTGPGVRATFDALAREVSLERTEVPTGETLLDWTAPREWTLRAATLDGPDGRVCDAAISFLHVLGYSAPVDERLSREELMPHLFGDPDRPDVVPFRTSYHAENWGFCLPQRVIDALPEGEYHALVDASLEDGSLTYAEAFLRGETEDEVLVSTYVDHPSLANDNTSGIVLVWALAKALARQRLRRSYRFLWSPATVGPLAWLARNEERLDRVTAGFVACCAGDRGHVVWKRSRRGDSEVDRAASLVLRASGVSHEVRDFTPLGGDERQFCSPGFDLPLGVLSRTPPDEFPEYHSSADDLSVVMPESLGDTFLQALRIVDVLEGNGVWLNTNPKGEPQLGRRGLYRAIGGGSFAEAALLWVLNLSDGSHDLLAIAERSGLPFGEIREAARALADVELLAPA